MPDEKVLSQNLERSEEMPSSPLPEEWVSLKEACGYLGLRSLRQVRRRLKAENWRTRLARVGGIMKRQVHRDDVTASKRDVPDNVIYDGRGHPGTSQGHVLGQSHSDVPDNVRGMSYSTKDVSVWRNEITKLIDEKIDKIIEPVFKLGNALEIGLDRLQQFQEQAARAQEQTTKFQERIIEIETKRDQERQEDREEAKKRAREERLKNRVIIGSYAFAIFGVLGLYWFLFWLIRSGRLFGGLW